MLIKYQDKKYPYCIMLHEGSHGHMWHHSKVGYNRPTTETRVLLDSIVGEGNWIYQSIFANDVDMDRLALWFAAEADQIAVKLRLM
jgi:hypothetical protein